MTPLYYIKVESRSVGLAAGVNDAPLALDTAAEGLAKSRPLNEWILPHGNRLTAFFFWPEKTPFKPGLARTRIELFIADPAQAAPRPQQVLATLDWPPANEPEAYPRKLSAPFDAASAPPTQVWTQAAPAAPLNSNDRQAILKLVENLRLALMGDDPQAAYKASMEKFEEQARAYGKPPERVRQATIEQFQMITTQPKRRSDPLPESEALLEPVADGRVIRVARVGDRDAVVIHAGKGGKFSIPVYVAKYGKEWRIVR